MRYIRTKTGYIFDKNNLDTTFKGSTEEYYFWKEYLRAEYLNKHHFLKDKILKEADNIEVLCDGYIFKDTNANKIHLAKKGEEDGMFILGASLFIKTVRYFIETDDGLIYVAKINDKGELELL